VGENKDTGGSNGAGKSTPFNVLVENLRSSTPLGLKKDELVKRGGNFHSHVVFEKDKNEFVVDRYRQHDEHGDAVHIHKNGEPIHHPTRKITENEKTKPC